MTTGWSGLIIARQIFTGLAWNVDFGVVIEQGRVRSVGKCHHFSPETIELPQGTVLAAGFIDTQVNGGGGVLLNAAPTLATIRTLVDAHRRHGTTGLLPTLITDTPEKLDALLAVAPEAMTIPGVLGFHLEGPFLNPARKGVHRGDLLRRPTEADIVKLKRFAAVGRSVVTLAPEMFTTAQLKDLASSGLRLAAGHSEATYQQMREAADAGVTGVTHLFNAMSQIGPRDGGVVGAALDDARLFAGVIADGHHVSASNLRLALTAKSRAQLMLVTDAMPTAASTATTFDLQGRTIRRIGDRLTDAVGTLAGAHLTMNQAVNRFTATQPDADMTPALIAASHTPARFLGFGDTLGMIQPGYVANFVAFRADTMVVTDTWLNGIHQSHIAAKTFR